MTHIFKTTLLLFMVFGVCQSLQAQTGTVTGTVGDRDGSLAGATVVVQDASIGVFTDGNGIYELTLPVGDYNLEANYVGFAAQVQKVTIKANERTTINFVMEDDLSLDEVILTGTRATNRTNTDAPVPVDVIPMDRLVLSAPQTNINQILHYAAPSFSSNTQTISDGTDHIDPASLRGLGPDQVLVLINGKRRHTSSLVNVNGTFGRGNVGTDMNSIPANAIQNVEVLRDGAAAQYGSDAIAGVINLRLKESVNQLRFSVNTGAHFTKNASPQKKNDGEVIEVGANYGIPLAWQSQES